MADSTQIRDTVNRYVAAFSAGDRVAWLGTFADDATLEDPVGSPVRTGMEAIGEFFDQMPSLADSITLTLNGPVIVCGPEAAFSFRAQSKVGESTFELDVIDVMTFGADARITAQRAFADFTAARPL